MKITPDHRQALAHLRRKEWDKAHEIVMDLEDKLAYRMHGLVHFIEDDLENARYWYGRAGVPFGRSVASEIKEIAALFTSRAAAAPRTNTRRSPPKRSGSRRSRA
ncbi:MAG TPA: hypothetical protein VIW78_12425 [Burkholderiales bacterium]